MKGYKGFDKDLKCLGYQYEVGKDYKIDKAVCCSTGFHFCENPFDVFGYYDPSASRFAEIEADGEISKFDGDSKVACTNIKIVAEIGLKGIIEAEMKFVFGLVNWKNANSVSGDRSGAQATGYSSGAQATGYSSGAQATGYSSGAQATGDRSGAQATGDRSGAQATGNLAMACANGSNSSAKVVAKEKESVAVALGHEAKAMASLNSFLVLAEWAKENDGWHIKAVKSFRVDGKIIKADTWYTMKGGKAIKA